MPQTSRPLHADLIREIYAVCETRGIPKTTFGLDAVNDASFVTDLENGREPRSRVLARVRDHLRTLAAGDAA